MSTILVVAPDGETLDGWVAALTRVGHSVLPVHAVLDAVARAREGGVEVIVLDAQGGESPVRALVAELERLPDAPPMVLVSDSPEGPALSARVGAAGFLPKPCSPEDLVEVVGRVASVAVRVHPFDEETTSPRGRF